jgi:histidinol-phosphate aminotransferase
LNLPPTFSVYQNNAQLTGTTIVDIPRRADYSIDEQAVLARVAQGDIDYIIIASPNNPTGELADEAFLTELLDATDALVMVDEAYFEFSRSTMRPYLAQHKNLLLLRTFSKAFSLAGVRMGYILANPEVITEFVKVRQPYSVDAVSQAIALEVFRHRELFEPGINAIIEQRGVLLQRLGTMDGITVYPSDSNYILFKLESADAGVVWQQLYDRGILVRDFSRGALTANCLRVSVESAEENEAFLGALQDILKG